MCCFGNISYLLLLLVGQSFAAPNPENNRRSGNAIPVQQYRDVIKHLFPGLDPNMGQSDMWNTNESSDEDVDITDSNSNDIASDTNNNHRDYVSNEMREDKHFRSQSKEKDSAGSQQDNSPMENDEQVSEYEEQIDQDDINLDDQDDDLSLLDDMNDITHDDSAFDAIAIANKKAKSHGLFEGDIKREVSDEAQQDAIVSNDRKWTKTGHYIYVPISYSTANPVSSTTRDSVNKAIAKIRSVSCVRLINRGSEADYINIIKSTGCWSGIGMSGGAQSLSLGDGCHTQRIATHEFMHALGFWHEQSRQDRDSFVTIHYGNIESGKAHNFAKTPIGEASYYGHPYDRTSIMHYGSYAFSNNGQRTIEWKANPSLNTGGSHLTNIDIAQLNAVYSCNTLCNGIDVPFNQALQQLTTTKLQNEVSAEMQRLNGQSTAAVAKGVYKRVFCVFYGYNFTVDVYNPVTGFDKHTVVGRYIHFFRHYSKNIVVTWRRQTETIVSQALINQATNEVRNALTDRGCDPKANALEAHRIISASQYRGKMAHVVIDGEGLHARRNEFNDRVFKYKCGCKYTGWWLGRACRDHYEWVVLTF